MNAHPPGAPFDIAVSEFVDAANAIAVVVYHDVLRDGVDAFDDGGGAQQEA
ncbi:hypothetical protein D3C85_1289840 [compost metagenome]